MTEGIRTAFILGAGLGTRLRPLTEDCPKPLLPVGGRPLISYAMDHCRDAGIGRFIVNTHHRAERYAEAFPDARWRSASITFRFEPILLDTGGGLKNIEDLLAEETAILVYNGDILSDLPLADLLTHHRAAGREVTLALRSEGPAQNVCLDDEGRICDIRFALGRDAAQRVQFTGIYVVETGFLRRLASRGTVQDIVPVWINMIREVPGSVAGIVLDAGRWNDIGSRDAYEEVKDGWA